MFKLLIQYHVYSSKKEMYLSVDKLYNMTKPTQTITKPGQTTRQATLDQQRPDQLATI